MTKRFRTLILGAFVAVFAFGLAGSAYAGAEGDLPLDAHEDCVENVMDLPALNVCKDAQGRHILDLPAIGALREPAPAPATPAPAPSGKKLPKTGLHVEDMAAIGLAALAGGAILLRRLRLAVA
jgi:LPXTG-motif cell wall-anchored protein